MQLDPHMPASPPTSQQGHRQTALPTLTAGPDPMRLPPPKRPAPGSNCSPTCRHVRRTVGSTWLAAPAMKSCTTRFARGRAGGVFEADGVAGADEGEEGEEGEEGDDSRLVDDSPEETSARARAAAAAEAAAAEAAAAAAPRSRKSALLGRDESAVPKKKAAAALALAAANASSERRDERRSCTTRWTCCLDDAAFQAVAVAIVASLRRWGPLPSRAMLPQVREASRRPAADAPPPPAFRASLAC
jgi:hypothetical protein